MNQTDTIGFDDVLHGELDAIARRRGDGSPSRDTHAAAYPRAEKFGLFGLSFSGGGIRSATFNLGVLQALQELKLLDKIDYLSTVSGGGYIGSWFISWIKRKGAMPDLAGVTDSEGEYKEPNPIRHLRRYSNYLTPKVGLMNADTWSIVSMYLRNLILNLLVLIPLLVAALIVPHLLLSLLPAVDAFSITALFVSGYLLLVLACFCVGLNLVWKKQDFSLRGSAKDDQPGAAAAVKPPRSFAVAVASTFGAAGVAAYILTRVTADTAWHLPFAEAGAVTGWVAYGFVLYVCLWILALIPFGISKLFRRGATREEATPPYSGAEQQQLRTAVKNVSTAFSGWSSVILGGAFVGPVCGIFFYLLLHYIFPLLNTTYLQVVFGMPAVVAALAVVVTLQIGIAGSTLPDFAREWWSRFGGWAMIVSITWMAATSVAFYSHALVEKIPDWIGGLNLSLAWAVTTASGLFAAKSKTTGSDGGNPALEMFVKATPMVFVIGIVTITSFYVHDLLSQNSSLTFAIMILSCVAISVFFAWRVNVNVFSMNSMYYNRLVRCYLGASRDRTDVNPVIGFDEHDDEFGTYTFMKDYGYSGPFPIINTAVNLVKGKELSWQKRKANSFSFTPLHCGFKSGVKDCFGAAGKYPTLLGRAVSISGAAASPNMGYHTSVPLAFLMTIFNVRLGSWFPNPAVMKPKEAGGRVNTDGPTFGLFYLLKELFGLTDDTSRYVYLSDGGHFENLGLYELVRRRCKYIIVCDAGADPKMGFGDLGNAIEKCRSDFGVEIELNVDPLRRDPKTCLSQAHWVVGTIRYPSDGAAADTTKNGDSFTGEILYIKSTVTGDEPADVLSYRHLHKEFPHESTADQWFDESQFESYRKLGYHIVSGLSDTGMKSPKALMSTLSRLAPRPGTQIRARRGSPAREGISTL